MRGLNYALALVVLGGVVGCGGDSPADGPADALTGAVTLNGEPVEFAMVVVTGPDGRQASGPQLPGGRYRIDNPPAGRLKFKFAAGPPPVPGGAAPKAPRSPIPAAYFTDRNDLSFEYTGGRQEYDIDLKP